MCGKFFADSDRNFILCLQACPVMEPANSPSTQDHLVTYTQSKTKVTCTVWTSRNPEDPEVLRWLCFWVSFLERKTQTEAGKGNTTTLCFSPSARLSPPANQTHERHGTYWLDHIPPGANPTFKELWTEAYCLETSSLGFGFFCLFVWICLLWIINKVLLRSLDWPGTT